MKYIVYEETIKAMKSTLKYLFNENTFKIRQTLLFVSSILLFLFIVNPLKENNSYQVNIGIIKGEIHQPWILYLLVCLIVIYYTVYFFVNLRKTAVDNEKKFLYNDFLVNLSNIIVEKKISKIYDELHEEKISNISSGLLPVFKINPISKILEDHRFTEKDDFNTYIEHRTNISKPFINEIFLKKLEEYDFKIKTIDTLYVISHYYKITEEDINEFRYRKDSFMRLKLEDWFISDFPILYSLISLTLGISKIIIMMMNN